MLNKPFPSQLNKPLPFGHGVLSQPNQDWYAKFLWTDPRTPLHLCEAAQTRIPPSYILAYPDTEHPWEMNETLRLHAFLSRDHLQSLSIPPTPTSLQWGLQHCFSVPHGSSAENPVSWEWLLKLCVPLGFGVLGPSQRLHCQQRLWCSASPLASLYAR